MRLTEYTDKVLALSETLHRWLGALAGLDSVRRGKLADYADDIAATLARAADALIKLEADPNDADARRRAVREFGRIAGYVENIVEALEHHLDGRKLAGVKRRLEQLSGGVPLDRLTIPSERIRVDRIVAAEGYLRALADGLRT
jgi:hypothetical protein